MLYLVHARQDCPYVNDADEIITDPVESADVNCPMCGPRDGSDS